MVLVTSVFLTQLLCVLVPCDPQYQSADTSPILETKESFHDDNNDKSVTSKSELYTQPAIQDTSSSGLESIIDIQQLRPETSRFKYTECEDEHPYVTTNAGIVEGYRIQVVGGRKICAFEGIPFGEPPIGHLRFQSPQPKAPWKGILKATKYGPDCMQYNVPMAFRVIGSEDCLYLNVYTNSINAYQKRAVIVFIHGGGFFFGSTKEYGPAYLLQRDLVLVTIQYRLGVLGFISTGDNAISGNAGLKDQALALKWVHENISKFGGDRSRVTLLGQSAGSACVHAHLLSKVSRNYFSSAVSLSGTGFNYWSFFDRYQTRNFTNTFAKSVGCPTENSVELANCIREKNPVELVTQTSLFLDDWPYPANAFRPSIEVVDGNPDPFLTDYPENIYRRNEVANVPWIVTTTSGEGYTFLLFPFISGAIPTLRRNWYNLAIDLIDAETLNVDRERIVKRLTRFYFKKTPPEKAPVGTFAQIVTDRMFLTGIYEAAKAHTQVAPTYSYYFDHVGRYNMITNYGYPSSEWGAGHTEDLYYLFNGTTVYSGFQKGDIEFDISRIMVNMISNFAEKGVPVFTTEEGEDIVIWEPHQGPEKLNFLAISKYIGMIGDPFRKRIRFWRNMRLPDLPIDVIVGSGR